MCFIPLFRCSACSASTSHQLCALLCPLRFRAALPSAELALQVLLAALAAAFAVLLFAPAQRFVRSFFLQMRPPEWAADYVAPHPVATAGLALHFLLPALTALLWVSEGRSCNLGCAAAAGLGECGAHTIGPSRCSDGGSCVAASCARSRALLSRLCLAPAMPGCRPGSSTTLGFKHSPTALHSPLAF